jgi:hypothetical protein
MARTGWIMGWAPFSRALDANPTRIGQRWANRGCRRYATSTGGLTLGFVKAYAHNGFFESLDEIVHFYNTRDVEEWPDSEAPGNVNDEELGDLGLSAEEEALIVLFKTTLSDGYEAP